MLPKCRREDRPGCLPVQLSAADMNNVVEALQASRTELLAANMAIERIQAVTPSQET